MAPVPATTNVLTRPANGNFLSQILSRFLPRWIWRAPPPTSPVLPPYEHVTQIGDPILRQKSIDVSIEDITGPEVQFLIRRMISVLNEYKCVGLAAPQIGSPLNVMIMDFSQAKLDSFAPEIQVERCMEVLPLTIFINPKLEFTNDTKANLFEGCVSVRGYNAKVERFTEVSVSGWDREGRPQVLKLRGWNARIAQHEVDHLNGVIYVDIMDPKTFECLCWEVNNALAGRGIIDMRNK